MEQLAKDIFDATDLENSIRNGVFIGSRFFRNLCIHVYRFDRDTTPKPYVDLRLRFSEKQTLREEFKDYPLGLKLPKDLESAPVHSDDLSSELDVQIEADNSFLNRLLGSIIYNISRSNDHDPSFVNSINKSDYYSVIISILDKIRDGIINCHLHWFRDIASISSDDMKTSETPRVKTRGISRYKLRLPYVLHNVSYSPKT